MAVFLPAGEGRPTAVSTIGSTSGASTPPQPVAPGADQVLSTSRPMTPAARLRPPGSTERPPPTPLIGLFGGGGDVKPAVRFQTIGELLDPI